MQYVRAIKLPRRILVHRPGIDVGSRRHYPMYSLLVDVIGHLQANLVLGSGSGVSSSPVIHALH